MGLAAYQAREKATKVLVKEEAAEPSEATSAMEIVNRQKPQVRD